MTGRATFATGVMGIFTGMDKVVGGDFEKGLEQLRTVATAEDRGSAAGSIGPEVDPG